MHEKLPARRALAVGFCDGCASEQHSRKMCILWVELLLVVDGVVEID